MVITAEDEQQRPFAPVFPYPIRMHACRPRGQDFTSTKLVCIVTKRCMKKSNGGRQAIGMVNSAIHPERDFWEVILKNRQNIQGILLSVGT